MADDKRRQERAERIQRRAQNYINGDISLDTFFMLEQLDNEGDDADIVEELTKEREKKEAAQREADNRKEADKLREIYEQEKAKAEEPAPKKTPAPTRPVHIPDLDNMTAAEFRALSLYEQNELYNMAPDRVREILNERPAYMDIIDPRPQPKSYKGTTLQEFKQMTLNELQELYNADPALYEKLSNERAANA